MSNFSKISVCGAYWFWTAKYKNRSINESFGKSKIRIIIYYSWKKNPKIIQTHK